MVTIGILIAGCGRSETNSGAPKAPGVETHAYTVRGIVALLPSDENPAAQFIVRHEPIPHFRGEGGVLGMGAMEMPFPMKEGLSLDGITLGNKIELTFEVEYDTAAKRPTNYRATRVVRLPDEARLVFTGTSPEPGDPPR